MTPAERLALLRTLASAVREVDAEVAAQVEALAETSGADRWRTPYGGIRVDGGKPTVGITDEPAFLAWCQENHPAEVQTVVSVSTPFRRNVLGGLAAAGDVAVSQDTGEVVPWAGVTHSATKVVATAGADKDLTIGRWRSVLLDHLDSIAPGDLQAIDSPE